MKFLSFLVALGLLGYGYWHQGRRPISYPPGILIQSEPAQVAEKDAAESISINGFQLKRLARFAVDARLLHRKTYKYDRQAKLVPVDLALGWGAMSDQAVLDRRKISQSMRFYWYEYRGTPPIPVDEITSHSTNVHVIPAAPEIAKQCQKLRAGSLVHLSGDLVEASGPELGTWKSSLSRTDKGNGACELLWLTDIEVLDVATLPKRDVLATRSQL